MDRGGPSDVAALRKGLPTGSRPPRWAQGGAHVRTLFARNPIRCGVSKLTWQRPSYKDQHVFDPTSRLHGMCWPGEHVVADPAL